MELLKDLALALTNYFDLAYLALFILMSYIFKQPLCVLFDRLFFSMSKNTPSKHWVVAIIGILVALVFVLIPEIRTSGVYLKTDGSVLKVYGVKLFASYCVGTSFYDLFIYQAKKFFTKSETDAGSA